jgi:hypothetical protein
VALVRELDDRGYVLVYYAAREVDDIFTGELRDPLRAPVVGSSRALRSVCRSVTATDATRPVPGLCHPQREFAGAVAVGRRAIRDNTAAAPA